MALDTTLLTRTTRELFLPVLKNNIYNETPLMSILLSKGRVKEWRGRSLLWDVIAEKHSPVGYFQGYSTIPNQPANPIQQATLPNANYVATISISKEEEKLNSGNVERLLGILETQMKNAEATLRDKIATDIYGSGTLVGSMQPIVGLGAAVAISANTYANISRSAYTFWANGYSSSAHTAANMKDPTHASYLPSLMYTAFTTATHDGSPDYIVTTKKIFNIYMLIAQTTNLRFGNANANLGFAGVSFMDGTNLIFDDYCTANYMYFLNSNDWSFHVVPGANFDFDEDGGSMWKQPTDQLARLAHLIWMGQLRLDAPWQQYVYSSLAAT